METNRPYLKAPISEIAEAAQYLDEAVTAHMNGDRERASELLRLADMPVLHEWIEPLWSSHCRFYQQFREVVGEPKVLPKAERIPVRMPDTALKLKLLARDHFRCRFCGIPVIRDAIRKRLRQIYPDVVRWGRLSSHQHARLKVLWAQFDHVLPHSRGGNNDLDNIIVTCSGCNFGRGGFTLAQCGLADPRLRAAQESDWDGLERLFMPPASIEPYQSNQAVLAHQVCNLTA